MNARDCLVLVLVAVAVVAGTGSRVEAQPKSWAGESVVPTKPANDIKFGDRTGDKQVSFPFSGRCPIQVREDRDGWLRIHDGCREGWVDKADFVLARDAVVHFHRRLQANPKDTWALFMRAGSWLAKGEPDNAIKDFDEYIRLDPTDAAGYGGRGNAWGDKKDYDKAIKDYDEAIRLDPKDATTFCNRGITWSAKKDYDKAIKDYDEAIRLDSDYTRAFRSRGNAWSAKKDYDKAIKDYDEAIRLDPKDAYAVILGHFAARRTADADGAAARFLKDSARKLNDAWPYPVVRFLRGEIDEPQLLKLADDDDKRTEARCYLGLDHSLKGRKDEALAHFRWVKMHGTVSFIEYTIAVAELEMLERAEK